MSLKSWLFGKKPHNWFCYKISFWHQWVFACLHICICIYICTPPRPITAHNSLKSHSLSILATDTYTKTHKPNRAYSYFHRNVPSFKIKVLNNRAYLAFLQETILEKRNSSSVASAVNQWGIACAYERSSARTREHYNWEIQRTFTCTQLFHNW